MPTPASAGQLAHLQDPGRSCWPLARPCSRPTRPFLCAAPAPVQGRGVRCVLRAAAPSSSVLHFQRAADVFTSGAFAHRSGEPASLGKLSSLAPWCPHAWQALVTWSRAEADLSWWHVNSSLHSPRRPCLPGLLRISLIYVTAFRYTQASECANLGPNAGHLQSPQESSSFKESLGRPRFRFRPVPPPTALLSPTLSSVALSPAQHSALDPAQRGPAPRSCRSSWVPHFLG